jgi:predicted metal-dependent hydrolase
LYDQLYVDFLYYFNHKLDYYECHEVLEELWLEEGRELFYQGLLQVAVGLYHFEHDNLRGAIKMMQSALVKLAEYPDQWMGIDLSQVKRDTEAYLQRLQKYDEEPFPFTPFFIRVVDPDLQKRIEQRL